MSDTSASQANPLPEPTSPADPVTPDAPVDPDCLGDQEFEDALEPVHLIRRSDVVLRAGILMLGAGTSALRVRQLMKVVAESVGLDTMRAQITYSNITLTVSRRGIFRTQVAETASPGVNADRISLLHQLTAELPQPLTAAEMDRKLEAIEARTPLYPLWLLTIAVAFACSGVCVLAGGSWREVLAVIPAASLAYLSHRKLGQLQINHLAVIMSSAVLSSGLFAIFTAGLDAAIGSSSSRMAAGFVCAPIFLIPGFPLVTGALDLTRIDLDAGIPRVTYAGMSLLSITIGVWLVSRLVGISPDPVPTLAGPPVLVWFAFVAASFCAVMGWAMMFNAPLRTAVAAGVIAVVANLPRLVMLQHGVANHVATFVCCFLIGIGCHLLGNWFKLTKIIMTVPGTLVAIPGSSALRTLIYFDQSNVLRALDNGIATVLTVIAMVAGLSAARMLTDPEWAFTRPDPPNLLQLAAALPGIRSSDSAGDDADD